MEPVGRPGIDWKLITDLPVESHDATVERLRWFAMRWKIGVLHKVAFQSPPDDLPYGLMNAAFKQIDLLPTVVLDWIGGRVGAGEDRGERTGERRWRGSRA